MTENNPVVKRTGRRAATPRSGRSKNRLTVGHFIRNLAPALAERRSTPKWPPNVFAISAALLQRSGAYARVCEDWPPPTTSERWTEETAKLERAWRSRAAENRLPPILDLRNSTSVVDALLK